MRRTAVTQINLTDVEFNKRQIRTIEKAAREAFYDISRQGIDAIQDYVNEERMIDDEHFQSPALFLPSSSRKNSTGRLHPKIVNDIWNDICGIAGVLGKTPYSARHGMGRRILKKTSRACGIAAVQRQLNHTNAVYSLQFSRITGDELTVAPDDR